MAQDMDCADGPTQGGENITIGEYLYSWLEGPVLKSTFDRYLTIARVDIELTLGRLKLEIGRRLTRLYVVLLWNARGIGHTRAGSSAPNR